MTKHVAWIASHPDTHTVSDTCSFCTRMARYSVGIAHSMTETTMIAACGNVECVARLYLLYTGISTSDFRGCLLAFLSDTSYVCMELLRVEDTLIEKVQLFIGADYRPLTMLIQQCKVMEDKRDSYTRLERVA